MVNDSQIRRLRTLMQQQNRLGVNARRVGIDEKSARKYLRNGMLPSETAVAHTWQTRADPFETVWPQVLPFLETNPGLEAKTLFEHLQRRQPGAFADGQLRTLQRKIRRWRALEGPPKEVFFDQVHYPGRLSQSDFTSMNDLGVTIDRIPFEHLVYHFVLTYSNWETGTVCFSESFESLGYGLQRALWELGGVPESHQTDRMSAAVQNPEHQEEFTRRYQGLLDHYRMIGRKIQTGKANENGDVEQRHFRFKRAVDQALMLRGSREFDSRQSYERFLETLLGQLNAGRQARFEEERRTLKPLPSVRLDTAKRFPGIRVSRGSLIRVQKNVYSVDSRLIGEHVKVILHADRLEVWYAGRCVEHIERLRGESKHRIQYRHIIDWLLRKPGAFEHYRYREDLFPSSRFRRAYDELEDTHSLQKAASEYLKILKLAAEDGELLVENALVGLQQTGTRICADAVAQRIGTEEISISDSVQVAEVSLYAYDALLNTKEFAHVEC